MTSLLSIDDYDPAVLLRDLLARRKARASLLEFTRYTLPTYQAAPHHRLIATKLEAVARGEIDRLMIFMPPRNGKSELASRRFPAWYLGQYPDRNIIAASYNSDLAGDFGREVRNIVNSPEYGVLFDTKLAADSQAANRWHTSGGGAYVAAGVGTAVTGRGCHVLLIDDPLKDREEAESKTSKDRVWSWYTSTAYTRLAPGGAIVVIQTRWAHDDLAGRLLEAEKAGGDKWEVLDMPAINDRGEALWPEFFPLPALERIRSAIGERDWASLYQQRPTPDGGNVIRSEWWQVLEMPKPDENLDIVFTVVSVDPAYTAKDDGDYTAITLWHIYVDQKGNTRILLRYAMAERYEFPELIIALEELCDPSRGGWRVNKLLIEAKGPGLSIIQEMRRRLPGRTSIHQWNPKGDKVARAHAVTPLLQGGMVHVAGVEHKPGQWRPKESCQKVIDQCAMFPAGQHDDLVDATTQALQFIRMQGLEFFAEDAPPPMPFKTRRVGY